MRESTTLENVGEAPQAGTASGRRRERTRPTREAVRRRILDAACHSFAARGFDAVSLDEVAEAAGFTKGAVYSNFGSKEALILALMDGQVTDRLGASADALSRDDLSFAERMRVVGDQLTQALRTERMWQSLFLEFWQRAIRDPAVAARFTARRQALRQDIARVIDEQAGRAGVALPLPSAHLATVILALSNGLAIERYPDPAAVPDDLFGRILQVLLAGTPAGSGG